MGIRLIVPATVSKPRQRCQNVPANIAGQTIVM